MRAPDRARIIGGNFSGSDSAIFIFSPLLLGCQLLEERICSSSVGINSFL